MATNSVVVIASGLAAIVGARVGDQLAPNVRALSGATELEREVNQIVRTIGRFIAVKVPKAADIDDIEGYEPVPADTIASFAGAEFLFPRGLTVDELHDRVVDRLRSDHGVGHVDLELTDAGAIDYLAVGSRTAGIGPTLPLRHGAIGVQAVPAPDASPGDRVDLWAAADDGARRVAQGELRGTNGDVATVVTDVHRIASIDQSTTYDLVTRRSKQRPDLEFASLLRSANETMDAVTVGPGTPIVGIPVGALTLPVVAIRDAGGRLHPVPRRHYVCEDGDTLYVIGRHDELRKFRAAAGASAPVTTPGAAIDGTPAGDSVYSRLRTYSEKAIPSRFRREP